MVLTIPAAARKFFLEHCKENLVLFSVISYLQQPGSKQPVYSISIFLCDFVITRKKLMNVTN